MSVTISNTILTSTNTTYIIFKFIIYMCWRDSILGKFQLSGFIFILFFMELIQSLFHLEFPPFLKQTQKNPDRQ